MESEKKPKMKYYARLVEGIPYRSRKLSDGTKMVNQYNDMGIRTDAPVEIKKTIWDTLVIRDKVKRENNGMPEFELTRKEVK